MLLKKNKIIISLLAIATMTACSPKQYSFDIDAPPKYSSNYIFKSMSVKDFKSNQNRYGQSIINMLKSGIAKEGYIKISEYSGDAVLSGALHIGRVHTSSATSSYECTKKINDKKVKTTCYNYTFKKKHLLKVDYSLHSNRENSIVFGESLSEEFEDSWSSRNSASSARIQAKSDDEIINNSLQKIANKIVKAVTPHKETISRELQDGSSDNVKLGIKYIENGRVEQALAIWDQCVTKATSTKERAAAYYNIGVIKESKAEYRDAFALYSKANVLLPKEGLYIKAMTRVEKLNKKVSKVRQWKSQ